MNVQDKVNQLRAAMRECGMDAYVIPSADNHQSEYVGEYFKARAFLTGFSGSAGTAVVTQTEAGLWTDGRYFIQAERQLDGSGIRLFKSGNPGVPTMLDYLATVVPQGGKLGFDGRLLAMQEGQELAELLAAKQATIEYRIDLVDRIWQDRPTLAGEPVFLLAEKYAGESATEKLNRLRNAMREAKATHHLLTSLDDIAWLLNMRGNDVRYSPLVLCYAIVTLERVELFVEDRRIPSEVRETLQSCGVMFRQYNEVYQAVRELTATAAVLLDPKRINYALHCSIPEGVKRIEAPNPTILFKAVKNSTELANIEQAHIKDGVACSRFIHWLKTNAKQGGISELRAAEKLEELRCRQDGYLGPSFAPICATGEHAAMMHYSATPETDAELKNGQLFLADTGGHYYEGSTDITRTIAIGGISAEQKRHFTAVVRGMLNLARATFLYGCKGANLDVLARQPIWELGLDYKCGTGHGIGYLLNIHEGPSGFRWYDAPGKNETHPLEAGMVITDEPGIYVEGSHGIRVENELIVRAGVENAAGRFMHFETVSYAPIDLDALEPSQLNADEKRWLNRYHAVVYQKLAPHLSAAEQAWLKEYTREI